MLKSKKALGLGITDWASWLIFVLVILIFFLLFKFSFGQVKYNIADASSSLENQVSLLSILKTDIIINNEKISIADLIYLSKEKADSKYDDQLKLELIKLLDNSFGIEKCSMVCIQSIKFPSSGCTFPMDGYICGEPSIRIPSQIRPYESIDIWFGKGIKWDITESAVPWRKR